MGAPLGDRTAAVVNQPDIRLKPEPGVVSSHPNPDLNVLDLDWFCADCGRGFMLSGTCSFCLTQLRPVAGKPSASAVAAEVVDRYCPQPVEPIAFPAPSAAESAAFPRAPEFYEPWDSKLSGVSDDGTGRCHGIWGANDRYLLEVVGWRDRRATDPRIVERIIACVNYCAGIPTEDLLESKKLADAMDEMIFRELGTAREGGEL